MAGESIWGGEFAYVGLGVGFLLSLFLIYIEIKASRMPFRMVVGGTVGVIVGLLLGWLFNHTFIAYLPKIREQVIFPVLVNVFFAYLGLVTGARKGEEVEFGRISTSKSLSRNDKVKLLDTNVIIDGRIADICETGFIEGSLLIPQFVLQELQHIADSSDPMKRTRGRRGLDILRRMQKQVNIDVRIIDQDIPRARRVDAKLIALARKLNARIITNDFNLNKVAELQGVTVLNINQLANALKPVVLPGETMRVKVIKEGKEQDQGVAYLDDGTMVVVENGRELMDHSIDVVVTSVLQTTAGRMIFARPKEERDE